VIAEAGHYALVLALALALIQSTCRCWAHALRDPALMNVARSTALAQLLFVAASFAALVALHVRSDFSVVNVFENSHSAQTADLQDHRRLGNHEGSMLLWVLILALFGGLVAALGNNLPLSLRAHVLAVQAWVASAFYLSSWSLRILSCAWSIADRGPRPQSSLAGHRSRRCIRRCSISAMSVSRFRFPSLSPP